MTKQEFINNLLNKININQQDFADKIDIFADFLISENRKYNLTNLDQNIWQDFFWKGILPYLNFDFSLINNVLDLGGGNGCPGIILKLVYSNIKLTIVESNKKKCLFLEQLCKKLTLTDVKILNNRIELIKPNNIKKFDLTTARAVAKLEILLELLIPYTKVNGYCILPKGKLYKQEASNLDLQLKMLNASLTLVEHVIFNQEQYNTLIIKKNGNTNKIYPRSFSKIKKGFFVK